MSFSNRVVAAAQRGDRQAREQLARDFRPLVYNVVGRALNGHPDVEDVVQEIMLQVLRDLPGLRQPQNIRAWLLTITMRQIHAHRERAAAAAQVSVVPAVPGPAADFEELAILRLRLTGERRQVAEAARWLDDEDRVVLALWWQEAAGELDRGEVAAALDITTAYAAVRIQRMRAQLDRCRVLVAALEARPRCPQLDATITGWDGRPSPLWRKRIDRHIRECQKCPTKALGGIAVEQLLVGCTLVPVPTAMATTALSSTNGGALTGTSGTKGTSSTAVPRSGTVGRSGVTVLAASAVAVVVVVGGVFAYNSRSELEVTASVAPSVTASPAVTSASVAPSPSKAKPKAVVTATPSSTATGCGGKGRASRWASWPMPSVKTASYRKLANGTVRDEITCLEWQGTPAPDVYTFTEAKAYCAKLDGGGWHLPTRVELMSIVDVSRSGPAIDTKAFPGTPARFFWTSTPWAVTKTPLRAWIINFYEGLASNGAFQTGEFNARCVRSAGGTGRPDYQVAAGQVTDPETGLTWQRATSKEMSAAQATAYCSALTLGGQKWRLPTLRELSTTVDDSRVAPAIDTGAFPDTVKKGWYWTSDRSDPEPDRRWALNYDDGYTNYREIDAGYARCVR
ncbi:sigma-70 family RNA polymerase sigma factor [Actinoplanes sp. NPDC026670]|uniref:sigma-70 family RNA polymerase sigma factor n=1 Tax=Actinoplanes sp. NPDC026670 TaxID=3154700 RepID=UPI0033DFB00C